MSKSVAVQEVNQFDEAASDRQSRNQDEQEEDENLDDWDYRFARCPDVRRNFGIAFNTFATTPADGIGLERIRYLNY
jgi:hypothetical protein